MITYGELYQKYPENPENYARLGRHLWLDARSLGYTIERDAKQMGRTLTSKSWERAIPILDQGNLGSCTGNAGTGLLGTEPFYSKVGKSALGSGSTNAAADEKFAVQLYSDATKIDPYQGAYPPDDTGSSGLAVCKVLRSRGLVRGYTWATTAIGYLQLLQNGPVMQGMPWYNAFFYPDKNGFIDTDPHWLSSGVAGGHEVEAISVKIDATNLRNSVITFANSWGTTWGDAGHFYMRLSTYAQLSGVDLKQPVM